MLADHVHQRSTCTRRRAAFSLLELLAVVTILSILAVIIIPRIGSSTNRAKRDACNQYKAEINSAVERFLFDNGRLPADLSELENDPAYFNDAIPHCPVTHGPYVLDGVTGRVMGHVH